jgi:hypothetical protein
MSGTADKNWRSYVGPRDDGLTITDTDWLAPQFPRDWDDLFKCSKVRNLTARGLTIPAAREDSVDCVRGANYRFDSCELHGSVTIKGAITGWMFSDCDIAGTVEVGQFDNYWYPGRPPTCGGLIAHCGTPDGRPIRLKLWDSLPPIIAGSDVKVTRIPWLIWFPYFCVRYVINRNWRFKGL